MKKKESSSKEDYVKRLTKKILSYSENIEEEYDIMELIEDNISEVFDCDSNCSTCSERERGECMQNWKKANLYFLRKLHLDETKLLEFTRNIQEMIDLVVESRDSLKEEKEQRERETKEKFKSKFKEAHERNKLNKHGYGSYFT